MSKKATPYDAGTGLIKVTRNIRAKSVEHRETPVEVPESGVLYVYNVENWEHKMSFYDKIVYSFGVPSTQKPVFCAYLNTKVMHYERTCQGVYYCPHIDSNPEEPECTVKPCRFRFHTCDKHQSSLKKSGSCKFKLHFYVPQDANNHQRLLLCLGEHSHPLLEAGQATPSSTPATARKPRTRAAARSAAAAAASSPAPSTSSPQTSPSIAATPSPPTPNLSPLDKPESPSPQRESRYLPPKKARRVRSPISMQMAAAAAEDQELANAKAATQLSDNGEVQQKLREDEMAKTTMQTMLKHNTIFAQMPMSVSVPVPVSYDYLHTLADYSSMMPHQPQPQPRFFAPTTYSSLVNDSTVPNVDYPYPVGIAQQPIIIYAQPKHAHVPMDNTALFATNYARMASIALQDINTMPQHLHVKHLHGLQGADYSASQLHQNHNQNHNQSHNNTQGKVLVATPMAFVEPELILPSFSKGATEDSKQSQQNQNYGHQQSVAASAVAGGSGGEVKAGEGSISQTSATAPATTTTENEKAASATENSAGNVLPSIASLLNHPSQQVTLAHPFEFQQLHLQQQQQQAYRGHEIHQYLLQQQLQQQHQLQLQQELYRLQHRQQ